MRLRRLERRVDDLENVLCRIPEPQQGEAPSAPLYPPAGSLPRALSRIWELRQSAWRSGRQFNMLYDFLISKFPGAIEHMERFLHPGSLSPSGSDDLEMLARGPEATSVPPSGVDLDDPIDDFDTEEDEPEDDEDEVATGSSGHGLPAETPTTPAPKRRRTS